jgi:hypothetical protein
MLLLLLIVAVAVPALGADSTYVARRAEAVKACEAIDPSQSQSGLLFNPDGYRSYYLRSLCYQQAAVRFRDAALCAQVKERHSLFFSSWGYSERNCRALVEEASSRDRASLEAARRDYLAGHMTLDDFRIELNGNGRDFDVLPIVSGSTPHSYHLRLASGGAEIHANGYFVGGGQLNIFVRRADVERALGDLSRPIEVTATMTFALPSPPGDAQWSDAFVESVWPARERVQSVTKLTEFPRAGR